MEIVIAALISLVGVLVVALIRENRRAHGMVEQKLDAVMARQDRLADRQDDFAERLDEVLMRDRQDEFARKLDDALSLPRAGRRGR